MNFIAHALARRSGISGDVALDELLSGDSDRVMALLRMGRVRRETTAGLLAGIGDLLGIDDPGQAIALFDRMSDADVAEALSWLTADPAYKHAVANWERVMASAPSEPRPVLGRLDKTGRLVAADPELEALQRQAGSTLGQELALPQVAAVARLARELGIPVSRPAVAASIDHDIDLWVRASPEGDEVVSVARRLDRTRARRTPARSVARRNDRVGLRGRAQRMGRR